MMMELRCGVVYDCVYDVHCVCVCWVCVYVLCCVYVCICACVMCMYVYWSPQMYCTICSGGEEVFMCDAENCAK